MKRTNTTLILGLTTAFLALTLAACTKQRPYEEVLKDQVQSKASIDTEAEYLYVPSTGQSSRSASSARPLWFGEAKLVKLRFGEKSLEVYEIERDARYAANTTNNKLVLSIPVEHVDYKCAENAVGECSNKEEENNKVTWSQKTKFKADFAGMKVTEVNTLPLQIEGFFSKGAAQEKESHLLNAKIESDAINIDIERIFQESPEEVTPGQTLSDLTFSLVHHYSLVKLNKLASPDYQPVLYPDEDQGKFGFFTTEFNKLSVDNRDRVEGATTYLNRWNPNRKEVPYYLADGFNKPENAAIKKATYEAFAAINSGLEKAGVNFRLVLKEPAGKNPGDIRDSMIALVEDPSAAGLLGYGPQIVNPHTGEIMSARVAMYSGITKLTIRGTYEDIRKAREDAKAAAKNAPAKKDDNAQAGQGAAPQGHATPKLLAHAKQVEAALKAEKKAATKTGSKVSAAPAAKASSKHPSFNVTHKGDLEKARKELTTYTMNARAPESFKSKMDLLSKNCVYSADFPGIEATLVKAIEEKLGTGDLKPWEDLSEGERQNLLDMLVPYVWTPILVHELGHNLGLRHNFQGSEDKANFYTEEELAKMDIHHAIPFSTVMEYAPRNFNELRTMGKYDVAALRFGYLRKVEKDDGQIIDVESTLDKLVNKDGIELKPYGFCTDEHVGINAGCKRFDEGTSYTEIAQWLIRSYEDRYKFKNFRNNARSFSTLGDAGYADALDDTFLHLRLFQEVRERLSHRYKITEDDWKNVEFLKDLDQAVALSRDFFLKVIAMPDVHCVVGKKGDPKNLDIVPLTTISPTHISCLDPELMAQVEAKGFEIFGQGGKSFHSRKDPKNPNPYADQVDVRGIWIDKILASHYLFERELGISTLDEAADNYLSYKDTQDKVKELLTSLIFNRVQGKVAFTMKDGSTEEVPLMYSMPLDSSQMILAQHGSIRRILGLPNSDTLLSTLILGHMVGETSHILHQRENSSLLDSFTLFSSVPSGRDVKDFMRVQIGSSRYYALPQNEVAMRVIRELVTSRVLSSLDQDKLANWFVSVSKAAEATDAAEAQAAEGGQPDAQAPQAPQAPAAPTLSDDEIKLVMQLDPELVSRYMQSDLEDEATYDLIIQKILLKTQ